MDEKLNVYIWDMDETLILLKSLLDGTYAGTFNGSKDVEHGVKIGKLWEDHILGVCDDHFFYEQIENYNQPHIDALSKYDDGVDLAEYSFSQDGFVPQDDSQNKRKLAYRHRIIAEKYKKGLDNIIGQDLTRKWNSLYDTTDAYTERWLSSARACLKQCAAGQKGETTSLSNSNNSNNVKHANVNVIVTSGPLIPSLVKCLFYRLDDIITCDNVYSSLDVGKLQCLSWVKERFPGPRVRFCVIGDGWEECEAAQLMGWPFVQIDLQPSSVHRFPGLTSADLQHYFSVIYGKNDDDDDSVEKYQKLV